MAKQTKRSSAHPGRTADIVREMTLPLTEELGLLLWDVRFVKEGTDWFLRVFLDREDTAVSIEDCVAVSRRLSDLLDEKDPIPQSYCLEVCSPGIERELTHKEHFERFTGAPVQLKLYHPRDGKRDFVGLLGELSEDGQFTLTTEEDEVLTFDRRETVSVHLLDDQFD
ncbi:MAG: ribosome maturation factor RimP [Clostridia bacterium]|nr:ribosome maturation factor RimP [Clostridia bacterium]